VAASSTIRTRRPRRCSHHRASRTHPALEEITIRWRGGFGYLSAWAGEGDDDEDEDEEIRLCRIEYLGGDAWAFARYDLATEGYTPAALVTEAGSDRPPRGTTPPPSSTSPATRSNDQPGAHGEELLRRCTMHPRQTQSNRRNDRPS